MRRVALRALGVVALITMVGCGKEELSAPRIAGSAASAHSGVSYVITTGDSTPVIDEYALSTGSTVQLKLKMVKNLEQSKEPRLIYADLPGAKWESSFPEVATVSARGLVTAVGGAGSATITASVGAHSASIIVRIHAKDVAPTADFSYSCAGLACSFTDRSTTEPIVAARVAPGDGAKSTILSASQLSAEESTTPQIVAWRWEFGDGDTSTVQNPSHSYDANGTYTVVLTVTLESGTSGTTAKSITAADFAFSCVELTCSFTDRSTSPGQVVQWYWEFADGETSTAQNPTHTFATSGFYYVEEWVYDNVNPYNDPTLVGYWVTVPPTLLNLPPTADFSVSCVDLTCVFTDQSTDPNSQVAHGEVGGWYWTFGDGGTGLSPNWTHTYSAAGTYTVELRVDDRFEASTISKPVTVAVNQPPTAAFTSSCPLLSCTFTDGSTDADGRVVAWSWDFGDGATSTSQNPSHTYDAGATRIYTVRLTVTDDGGKTASVSTSVTVSSEPNQPPTAAFASSCGGLSCRFSLWDDTDPDGYIVAWSWSFGDGATSSDRNPPHTYESAGTYTVRLTVTDNRGATASASRSFTVPPNVGPTAAFTFACSGLACTFTDQSTDPDGRVVAWSWRFGDGATSTDQNPSHTYDADGTYWMDLEVTDDSGKTARRGTGFIATAGSTPNRVPSAYFTSSCNGLSCTFTDQSGDLDGRVVAWSWDFGDGTGTTSQNPSHTYAAAGLYSVHLTVTDDRGATESDGENEPVRVIEF